MSYPLTFYVMFGVWAPISPTKRALYYAFQNKRVDDAKNFKTHLEVPPEWQAYDDDAVKGAASENPTQSNYLCSLSSTF